MTLRTTLAILALTLTPGIAAAYCPGKDKMQSTSASACGEGQVWDSEAQACLPKPVS